MNSLRALYSQASEMFWQQPKLWVYPLTAELVRYAVRLLANQAQSVAVKHLIPASVLGGYAGRNIAVEGRAVVASATIGAFANGTGLLAYLFALGLTVNKVNKGQTESASDLSWFIPNGVSVTFLKLMGFFLAGAALALTMFYASPSVDLTVVPALAGLLLLAALYLAVPTVQRYVRLNQNQDAMHPRLTDFLLIVQAFAISGAFQFAFNTAVQHDSNLSRLLERPLWSFVLIVPVVLIGAMPYVWSMIALGLNVGDAYFSPQSDEFEQGV